MEYSRQTWTKKNPELHLSHMKQQSTANTSETEKIGMKKRKVVKKEGASYT